MQIRSRGLWDLGNKDDGFVMGVIGKWLKVFVFAPEPTFYSL